jgi:hypothetical protein
MLVVSCQQLTSRIKQPEIENSLTARRPFCYRRHRDHDGCAMGQARARCGRGAASREVFMNGMATALALLVLLLNHHIRGTSVSGRLRSRLGELQREGR